MAVVGDFAAFGLGGFTGAVETARLESAPYRWGRYGVWRYAVGW